MKPSRRSTTLFLVTPLVLVAFAANSVLCRLALGQGIADAAGFTTVRLASGALMLGLLGLASGPRRGDGAMARVRGGGWWAAAMLFLYAAGFSYAYLALDTASGALILFASVQLTLMAAAMAGSERLGIGQWLGAASALAGLAWLLLPGASHPSLVGAMLMIGAGVAWGAYTLAGRGSRDPFADTSGNFLRTLPFAAVLLLVAHGGLPRMPADDWAYAVASGALASALGYVGWYRVVPVLGAVRSGIVQMLSPVLAALGGMALAGEHPGWRLWSATAMVLGGIALSSWAKASATPAR